MRYGIVATACVLLLRLAAAEAAPGDEFRIRVDGKILRKASGKLVLSLSSFELSGMRQVGLENRKTGEKKSVALSSVYPDISYTEPLAAEVIGSIEPNDWFPYIVWRIPDDPDALRERLSAIYEYQNGLRRELGRALLEDRGEGIKVSSRLTLNKIEKFHRIAAVLAAESLKIARERDELNDFLVPLHIRIGFNPFGNYTSKSAIASFHDVREVIYWEVHRILTQQFGVGESLVDFVFDAPSTVRNLLPFDTTRPENFTDFYPNVTIEGATIYCALYLQRQEFEGDLKQLIRVKDFRDPFIKDRPVVDRFINEGKVLGIHGNRVAVTFAPPFMKQEEILYIAVDPAGKEEIPIVLLTSVPDGGYSLAAALPDDLVAQIRPGMPVRRK